MTSSAITKPVRAGRRAVTSSPAVPGKATPLRERKRRTHAYGQARGSLVPVTRRSACRRDPEAADSDPADRSISAALRRFPLERTFEISRPPMLEAREIQGPFAAVGWLCLVFLNRSDCVRRSRAPCIGPVSPRRASARAVIDRAGCLTRNAEVEPRPLSAARRGCALARATRASRRQLLQLAPSA